MTKALFWCNDKSRYSTDKSTLHRLSAWDNLRYPYLLGTRVWETRASAALHYNNAIVCSLYNNARVFSLCCNCGNSLLVRSLEPLDLPMFCTLEERKQKAVDLMSALSLSTRRRLLSSRRLRYFPVVTCRRRKGWPHRVWLPLHLQMQKKSFYFNWPYNATQTFFLEVLCLLYITYSVILYYIIDHNHFTSWNQQIFTDVLYTCTFHVYKIQTCQCHEGPLQLFRMEIILHSQFLQKLWSFQSFQVSSQCSMSFHLILFDYKYSRWPMLTQKVSVPLHYLTLVYNEEWFKRILSFLIRHNSNPHEANEAKSNPTESVLKWLQSHAHFF